MARNATLRYLDDLLERLEQLNLNNRTDLPEDLARELGTLGVERPYSLTIPELIEHVWDLQEPHLTPVVFVRQPSKRRQRKSDTPEEAPALA